MGDGQEAPVLEEPVQDEAPVVVPEAPATQPSKRGKRSQTVRVTKRHLAMYRDPEDDEIDLDEHRPKTRDDCIDGERPCPFVGCKHHLFLDVSRDDRSITLNFPGKELEELADTCALDVAGRGGATLEDVGNMFNLTRERIRQIEGKALGKLKNSVRARALREEHDGVDGVFAQGKTKPKYVPTPRAELPPEPPPAPKPAISSPEPIWYTPPAEKPTMPAPTPRDLDEEEPFELDEPDAVEDEEEDEEEEEDNPEAEDEAEPPPPTPEEKPMPKKDRPIKVTELTARETLVVKHYLRLAEKEGQKPSPLAIARACKLEGTSNASISASVCTALTAAQRKGVKLPFIDERRSRANIDTPKKAPRAKRAKAPPPPVSAPALPVEVVDEVPSTAMVALSTPDAMKNVLLLEKEKLQKKLAAIDVLLTL